MTPRDGGYDYEDGCPECGARVWEGDTLAICKAGCGWVAHERAEPAPSDEIRKRVQDRLYALYGRWDGEKLVYE